MKNVILFFVIGSLVLFGCRKQEPVHESTKNLQGIPAPKDAWIAVRLKDNSNYPDTSGLANSKMAGFLIPLDCDRGDPDWVFRYGQFCRDVWNIKRIADTYAKGKVIITKNASSFISKNQVVQFEDYPDSTDKMFASLKNQTPPDFNELPNSKGVSCGYGKFKGQHRTSAGLIISTFNRPGNFSDLRSAWYVPDISKIDQYWPITEIPLEITKGQGDTQYYPFETILQGWNDSEIQVLETILKKHGGKQFTIYNED
jgi:hypothetical protein